MDEDTNDYQMVVDSIDNMTFYSLRVMVVDDQQRLLTKTREVGTFPISFTFFFQEDL